MTTNEQNLNDRQRELLRLYGKYRGLRAFLLTRVSTGSQSHDAQERAIRENLVDLIDLKLDEERHVRRDTYTGLEYRYRAVLDDILHMAERREFDVLCLDVLDRGLGRKGVSREIFRGQLRELGIHVLTTEPSDHSDDDSLEGQSIRILKGYKAEEEVNDFVRRVQNAKRDKALGKPEKGVPPKVVGNGGRCYGYKYVRDAKGKIETLELNYDVVWKDSKGVEWTEVRVVVFIFRCAQRRIPLRQICQRLNNIGIPAPYISMGRKYTSKGIQAEKLLWQSTTINKWLRNTTYSGRYAVNKYRTVKVPGKKSSRHIKTSPGEWIIVPVPALVSVEQQEEVTKNLPINQRFARRNKQQEEPVLLHGGLAKCGNCGRTARPVPNHGGSMSYRCSSMTSSHKCRGCNTKAFSADEAAWEVALEIIHNSSQIDKAFEKQKAEDPTASRRKRTNKDMAELESEREALQSDLKRMIREKKLDRNTEDALTKRLREIDQQIHQYAGELADDEKMHQEWTAIQRELERLHQKCAMMREKLKDPNYVPKYEDKRDIIEFFGITAILWESGHINPETGRLERIRIQVRFADIMVPIPSNPPAHSPRSC